jgi:hypothetical protein
MGHREVDAEHAIDLTTPSVWVTVYRPRVAGKKKGDITDKQSVMSPFSNSPPKTPTPAAGQLHRAVMQRQVER